MYNFPDTPFVGQVVTNQGITRVWDGSTWSIMATTIQGITGATGAQGVQGPESANPIVTNLLFGGM